MSNNTRDSFSFGGFITHEQYALILEVYSEALIIESFLGFVSNIINIRTFCAMGLADGITVSFLSLSIFDLMLLAPSLLLGITISMTVTENRTPTAFAIDPHALSILLANIIGISSVTNILPTTFLAVARCMCVAKPLHFKNWFTTNRTLRFTISFAVIAVVSFTPFMANMGLVAKFDVKKNITRQMLWLSSQRESIKVGTWLVVSLILPSVTQFIVVVCVLIMANSLRASAKFRQSAALLSNNVTSTSDHKQNAALSSTASVSTDKLAGKDVRVVQQVVLISLVFIICNTPKMVLSVTALSLPEFTIGKRYHYLYLVINMIRQQFDMFNASVNTFIYYRYNTKFRLMMLSLFT
ncbi:hypothetical protein BsWGS_12769 [Bradybaena similaris]